MIIPADIRPASLWQLALVLAALYVANKLVKAYRFRARSTPLAGPPSTSWIFGVSKSHINNPDAPAIYEDWVAQYGPVFRAPAAFGSSRLILTDPKAIAHFYSVETWTYVQTSLSRIAIEKLVRVLAASSRSPFAF